MRRHGDLNEQTLSLELALRLSGNTLLLESKQKSTADLANSAAFRDVHPAIIGYLEEFGPLSGIVTPVGEQQISDDDIRSIPVSLLITRPRTLEAPWQLYLGGV